jgi:hypothetical protein
LFGLSPLIRWGNGGAVSISLPNSPLPAAAGQAPGC